jgi:hypothetical protein
VSEFELQQFERSGDRLRVSGRWSGVRGMRFVRPTLTVGDRRVLAVLDHKPWAPEDGVEWVAEFPWEGDPGDIDLALAELAVAPSVAVSLAAPGVPVPAVAVADEPRPDPAELEAERRRRQQAEIAFLRQQIDLLKGRLEETERERDEARADPAPVEAVPVVNGGDERLAAAEAARGRARDERDKARDERDDARRELAKLRAALAADPPAPRPVPEPERAPAPAPVAAAPGPALDLWIPRAAGLVAAVCILLLLIGLLKVLYATAIRPPRDGANVIARRTTLSSPRRLGCSVTRSSSVDRTIRISNRAKLAPRQRRTPPPNGIHS